MRLALVDQLLAEFGGAFEELRAFGGQMLGGGCEFGVGVLQGVEFAASSTGRLFGFQQTFDQIDFGLFGGS